jgi:hypothetical protein
MVFDENSSWVGFVGQGVNCGVKMRSRRENSLFKSYEKRERSREILYNRRII